MNHEVFSRALAEIFFLSFVGVPPFYSRQAITPRQASCEKLYLAWFVIASIRA